MVETEGRYPPFYLSTLFWWVSLHSTHLTVCIATQHHCGRSAVQLGSSYRFRGASAVELFVGPGIALIVGFVAGAVMFSRMVASEANHKLKNQLSLNYTDQNLFMTAMARNYAQIIFPRVPDRFVEIEETVYRKIKSMAVMTDDQLGDILDEISQRNLMIADFDKIGLRDYVFYDEGLFSAEFNVVVQAYEDCCLYGVFLGASLDFEWVRRAAERYETSHLEKEGRFIKQYAREYKDSLFMHRCLNAMRQFSAVDCERSTISCKLYDAELEFDHGTIFNRHEPPLLFKGEGFEVYAVSHIAEIRHGIKFLDTGECAVRGAFYGDDKTFVNWHRTDDNFEELHGHDSQIWTLNTEYITVPFDYLTEKNSPYTR